MVVALEVSRVDRISYQSETSKLFYGLDGNGKMPGLSQPRISTHNLVFCQPGPAWPNLPHFALNNKEAGTG